MMAAEADGTENHPSRKEFVMNMHILLAAIPVGLTLFAPVAVESAYAADAIVSPLPTSGGGSPMVAALETTKAFPEPYPGREGTADMTGKVVVHFHVGSDGHPEDIQIVDRARRGELNRQTKESVAGAVCLPCAGQDYTVAFVYREK
jgi:TonB family protein